MKSTFLEMLQLYACSKANKEYKLIIKQFGHATALNLPDITSQLL